MMDDLSEERITQIATNQHPTDQMQAYTIDKDFRTSVEPAKATYDELPSLEVISAT